MPREQISLKARREIRRTSRREAYSAVRGSQTLEQALQAGERQMRANYGGAGLTIALFIIAQIIKYLWENRDRNGTLMGLPPDWEARFDPR